MGTRHLVRAALVLVGSGGDGRERTYVRERQREREKKKYFSLSIDFYHPFVLVHVATSKRHAESFIALSSTQFCFSNHNSFLFAQF